MFVITTCWGDTDAALAIPAMNSFCLALNWAAGVANFVRSVMALLPGQAFLMSGHFTWRAEKGGKAAHWQLVTGPQRIGGCEIVKLAL
jgi:hypothetical protein